MSPSNVQKIKLQLFQCLQCRHRDAWKQYWSSFQLYLVAKISLEEFHTLTEELLGPDTHIHNKLVLSLLCGIDDQEASEEDFCTSPQPPLGLEVLNSIGEGNNTVVDGGRSTISSNGSLMQHITEEGNDIDQRQKELLGQSCSSNLPANNNAEETVATKLMHVHPDHQSAQLLMRLGKCVTTSSPPSIVITPVSTPPNSNSTTRSLQVSRIDRKQMEEVEGSYSWR